MPATLKYTPDSEVKTHDENMIRLICSAFQSHEAGLPEWLKNSADAYAREDMVPSKRVIVVLIMHNQEGTKPVIGCLDFVGMTVDDVETHFRHWGAPDAADRGEDSSEIQGGHGNGGKCYMVQMFDDHAVLATVRDGKGARYGVASGSHRFGYVPDQDRGRGYPVDDITNELSAELAAFQCTLEDLPDAAREAAGVAKGFTLVKGVGPKGRAKKVPVQEMVGNLQDHPQMIRTLELCDVFVVVNGSAALQGEPISLPEIPPLKGADGPREYIVPDILIDPVTRDDIKTREEGDPKGVLRLYTSAVSMRWKKKYRHNIIFRAQSGYIGVLPVPDLDVNSSYRDRIYGDLTLLSLEQYKQNDRARLADAPLTRAVERFVASKLQEYAAEFEARDRRRYQRKERDQISKMNEALDRWKNKFLKEQLAGLWGEGEGPGQERRPRPSLPKGVPARIEVTLTHSKAGVGVSLRPSTRFYDEEGRQIRSVPFRWVSEDTNIAWVDGSVNVISTFAPGTTRIRAESVDGKVKSEPIPLEVVSIQEIEISPKAVEVPVGSRNQVTAVCTLPGGAQVDDVYLIWTEDDNDVARVSSSGLVYAYNTGTTRVSAGDDKAMAKEAAEIRVVEGGGKGKGGKRGRGYPLVLISGEFDVDPETEEHVYFSSDEPPVAQRVQDADRNVWWINSAAPLAQLYLDTSQDYGYDSIAWRIYHVERYMDVITQIAMRYDPESALDRLSVDEWLTRWGHRLSDIQNAAAVDLRDFIAGGTLPED